MGIYRTSFALLVAFLAFPGPSCTNSDNLAFLLDTLKIVQRAVCDDEMVSLACPRGTSISIQLAQYGKAAPRDQGCVAELAGSQSEPEAEKKCKRPNAMQYSLLQTVVEACQKKPQCKFSTIPKPGLIDPCPFARKYVEVAYKCRPYEFRSRTGCEDEVIKLSCNPHSRVAIFDAQFGRTAYESITCPQAQGIPEETCMAPYAVETVMQMCLGKRRCQISANSKTFESSCKPHSRPYLKVIYACVPLGVLIERYESAAESDEIANINTEINRDTEDLFDESDGAGEKWGEPNAVPPVADPALQSPQGEVDLPPTIEKKKESSIHNNGNNIDRKSDKSSNSKMFIYIGVAIIIIFIIITAFIGVRCYINRRQANISKNGDMFTTEAPNVFNDASSDIDNDIDVSHISGTFYDPVHPDMILYRDVPGSKGTIRAMRPLSTIYPCAGASMYGHVDYVPPQPRDYGNRFTRSRSKEEEGHPDIMTSPKSLGSYSTSQFYYG